MHMPLARCTRARRARRASVRAKKQALDLISRFRSSVNPTTSCQFSARNQTSQCCSSTRQARAHSALLRAMLSSSTRLLRITNLRSHLTAAHSGGRVCCACFEETWHIHIHSGSLSSLTFLVIAEHGVGQAMASLNCLYTKLHRAYKTPQKVDRVTRCSILTDLQ